MDLVKEFYPQAEFLTTPMRQEKERCEMALKAAQDGRKTAMICSGDSGVYGMACLLYKSHVCVNSNSVKERFVMK